VSIEGGLSTTDLSTVGGIFLTKQFFHAQISRIFEKFSLRELGFSIIFQVDDSFLFIDLNFQKVAAFGGELENKK